VNSLETKGVSSFFQAQTANTLFDGIPHKADADGPRALSSLVGIIIAHSSANKLAAIGCGCGCGCGCKCGCGCGRGCACGQVGVAVVVGVWNLLQMWASPGAMRTPRCPFPPLFAWPPLSTHDLLPACMSGSDVLMTFGPVSVSPCPM